MIFIGWNLFRGKPATLHLAVSRSWNAYGKIVATPVIAGNSAFATIGVGDQNGFFSVFDGKTGRVLLRYNAEGEILASVLQGDLGDGPAFVLSRRDGQVQVVRPDGVWLWKSRGDSGLTSLTARPARMMLGGVAHLILGDQRGQVVCLEGRHGIPRWIRRDAPSATSAIFAAPLARDGMVFLASTRGDVFALDAASGRDLWRGGLSNEVRASPVLIRISPGKWGIGAVDIAGGFAVFQADDGKLVCRGRLSSGCVSSPVSLGRGAASSDSLIFTTRGGEILRVDPATGKTRARFIAKPGDGFRSSPVAFDADGDGRLELLAVTSAGELLLLDGETLLPRIPPYALGGEVTASPVVADVDGDGRLELVVALETGEVLSLSLDARPRPAKIDPWNPVTGFRGDARNTGRFPSTPDKE
jgi:outer membrane protein assembly factor BamB